MTDPSPQEIRRLLLSRPLGHILAAFKQVCQHRWDGKGPHHQALVTTEDRYQAVLDVILDLKTLLPDGETRAREIYARISWPQASDHNLHDFVPPKFEKLFELPCARCNGTGLTGFLIGIRCPDC